MVAEVDSALVGAVWARIIDDYGHIDDDTPSLSISVKAPYRQRGIGTALMQAMLTLLKTEGYKQVSLSVQKANYARKMYLKLGFEIVKTNEEDEIMVCKKEKDMSDFKLTLLRKWEFDNEFSFVCASILLPDGTAVILTSDNTDWHKYYALVLSTEGVKKIPIEYTPMSNRDYPVLFRYKEGFGIIISAKEVRY